MIAALAALLGCQLAGEVFVRAFALPLPGPVAGLGLLFAALAISGRRGGPATTQVPVEVGRVADGLLGNLSLLFIPAAVGVVKYLDLLRAEAVPILLTIAVSTTLTLVVTALTFRFVSRLHAFRHEPLAQEIEQAAGLDVPAAKS